MIGNAHFNSLQATLDKRMCARPLVPGSTTPGRSPSTTCRRPRASPTPRTSTPASPMSIRSIPPTPSGIPAAAMVPDIKALDRGLSDIDHPQAFSVSYVYNFPKFNRQSRPARRRQRMADHRSHPAPLRRCAHRLHGDRQLPHRPHPGPRPARLHQGGLLQQNGGAAIAPSASPATTGSTPRLSPSPSNTGPGTGFGNVVKGTLRGPGFTNWDGAVVRTFPVFRESNLEFRMEYFDILNHTNSPTRAPPTRSPAAPPSEPSPEPREAHASPSSHSSSPSNPQPHPIAICPVNRYPANRSDKKSDSGATVIDRRSFVQKAALLAAGSALPTSLLGCGNNIIFNIPCLGPAAPPTPVAGMTYIKASEIGCALDCKLETGRNKYTGGAATDDGPVSMQQWPAPQPQIRSR